MTDFRLAYAESVSAVDFLIRSHGQDALVGLIHSYADGRTDDEAFQAATGMTMAGFSDAWLADNKAKAPVKAGPQPAPAGPLPAGWTGPLASSPTRGEPAATAGASAAYAPAPSAPASAAASAPPDGTASSSSSAGAVAAIVILGGLLIVAGVLVARWRRGSADVTVAARVRRIPSWQLTLGAAMLGLGFLIAAQLASEGPRVRYTTQERSPLIDTATQLQATQDGLKAQILDLRTQIGQIESTGEGSAATVRQLNDDLEGARMAAGLIPLTGTGIVLQLDDSTQPVAAGATEADYLVSSADIRTVIDELWLAGAEAIAVNGERITATTSVLDIGSSILANSAYLAPPYQVTAIGPPDLYDRLAQSPGFVEFVQARAETYGIRVSFAEPKSVDVPAFAGTVSLRYSHPVASASPATSGSPAVSASPGTR